MQRVMLDSSKTEAERTVQREFRKNWLITGALLSLAVLLFRAELNALPNRAELGRQTVQLRFQPVAVGAGSEGEFQVVGAWRLLVDDPRFGGLSALALAKSGFVGLTDSGVVVRFPRPDRPIGWATLEELPGGPGAAGFKVNRDSEALVADPLGRGWWVAFENRDEVWLYNQEFAQALGRSGLGGRELSRNRGIEGMVADGRGLILFPEASGHAFALGSAKSMAISGIYGWLSDAAVLPDGTIAVLNRLPTPIGLSNRLILLERHGAGYRRSRSWRIPVGRLDNVEGLAAEASLDGAIRLWMVTDNNLQQRRPTLLIAVELRPPPSRR
jgi:hypothetical protein